MALFISRKDRIKAVHGDDLHVSCLEIERWANQFRFNTLPLAANFAPNALSFSVPGWVKDPLGRVHLQGLLAYTGTITAGVSVNIASPTPAPIAPATIHRFPVNANVGGTYYPGVVDVEPSIIRVILGTTTAANPFVSLDGISYYPQL